MEDPFLSKIICFIVDGELPKEEKLARRLSLSRDRFEIIDGILCYVDTKSPTILTSCRRTGEVEVVAVGRGT